MSFMDVMYGPLGQINNTFNANLASGQAMNQANQAAAQQQQASLAAQQAQLANLYGPQGFGGQTAAYAGAGAAYGRETGGFNGGGAPTPAPANDPASQAYFAAYPDVAASGMTAAEHYMKYGAQEGRSAFGLDATPGAFPSGGTTPFNTYGQPGTGGGGYNPGSPDYGGQFQAPSTPSASFDQRYGQIPGQGYFPGYFDNTFGSANAMNASMNKPATVNWDQYFKDVTSPYGGGGTGTGWEGGYLAANPDVAAAGRAAGADPTKFADQHFRDYGMAEGRQVFDPVKYLQQNQDVAASGMDALQHWDRYGRNEGRSLTTTNVFDPATYLAKNVDVAAAGVDPTAHWLQYGQKEGRQGGGILTSPPIMNAGGDPSYIGAGQPGNSYNPFGLINSGNVGQQDSLGGQPPAATFDQRFGQIPGQGYFPGYFDATFGAANSQPQAYNPFMGGYPGRLPSDNMANQQQMIQDLYGTLGIIDNAGEFGRYQNQPYNPSGNTLQPSDYQPNWGSGIQTGG